jgi:hypothetical protein
MGYDAETLVSAHHMWEYTDLFRDFEVNFLDSSQSKIPKPLQFSPQNIESLINDMKCQPAPAAQGKRRPWLKMPPSYENTTSTRSWRGSGRESSTPSSAPR